nr:translation initiation factor IF-2 [Oryctolagus cuniculus]
MVRTLFEVPNLESKGRLSVLYSSPEAFRLSSCPRDRRARESAPLPPPRPAAKLGLKTFATGRRKYKGGRLPPLSWIWELSASVATGFPAPAPASLILGICVRSHRQSRQVALPRLRRKGGCGGRPGPSGAISIGSAPGGSPDPPPSPAAGPGPARFAPTLIPCQGAGPPPAPGPGPGPGPGQLNQSFQSWEQEVEGTGKGGKPRWPRHRTQNGGGQTSKAERRAGRPPLRASASSTELHPSKSSPGRPPS